MSNPQVQNDPIYSLPHLYINGLNVSVASTTVLAIAPGMARDSSDNIDMEVGFPDLQGNLNPPVLNAGFQQPLFINSAIVGANGLDQGTLAATQNYGVYLIGDSRGYKPVAGLLSSLCYPVPKLPLGYDSYRLVAIVTTDGAAHFVASSTNPLQAINDRCYYLSPSVSVLAGGNAVAFTAQALNAAIPTTTSIGVYVIFSATFIPLVAGDIAMLRPTGCTATSGLATINGVAAGVAQQQYIAVYAGVSAGQPSIDYIVSNVGDALSLSVVGYCFISPTYLP